MKIDNYLQMTDRPLISFALFAYNQEKFIRRAVEAVLGQTYDPLEIILSDDASSDNTAAIINRLAAVYDGPHQVIVNINEKNFGLAAHINKVMRMVSGDLIIIAAGDDVSIPRRTEIIVKAWAHAGFPPAICSDFQLIDENDVELYDEKINSKLFLPIKNETRVHNFERFIKNSVPSLIGCTEAWRKDLITKFPPLLENVWYEDKAFSFRAWLLGEIHYVPERLVKYRQHGKSISYNEVIAPVAHDQVVAIEKCTSIKITRLITLLENYRNDLDSQYSVQSLDVSTYNKLVKLIEKKKSLLELKLLWWTQSYLVRIILAIVLMWKAPSTASIKWLVIRLLPFRLYCRLIIYREVIKNAYSWRSH